MEHRFIKNRDIVFFSFQPWDTKIGSNFKDMALEMARHNRVLFVNRALDRLTYHRDKNDPVVQTRLASIKEGKDELVEIKPNLWVQNPRTMLESINSLPFNWLHDFINKNINSKRLAKEINSAIEKLGFKDVIIINDNDFVRGYYMREMIPCTNYIFYIRDFMLGVDYWKKHGPRHESGMMKKSDLVVANSSHLAKYSSQFNSNSFDIGQGCELDTYLVENPEKPEELKNIKGPIIGYAGVINTVRTDEQILKYIATNLPDCSIVLVGPYDDHFGKSDLHKMSNVHFLGGKHPSTLPNYIYYFDVCINPQMLNEVTIGNYPRKVDEYLAMGKPVVATKTDAMQMFEPYTYLCNNKEEYIGQIKKALADISIKNGKEQQKRRDFALSHSWENNVGRLGDAFFAVTEKQS